MFRRIELVYYGLHGAELAHEIKEMKKFGFTPEEVAGEIEMTRKSARFGIGGLTGGDMADLGLRCPHLRTKDKHVKFFFTERGWKEVGKKLLVECKRKMPRAGVVLRTIKENQLDVSYRDELQVAGKLDLKRTDKISRGRRTQLKATT